ncbi:MAG: hypothetical protein KC996_05035 [Phycisphaerales bacterium]|nr:hypothetical protein [Phycisphaerales bacterium]
MLEELIHNLTGSEDVLVPFIIFTVGGLIAIIAIVFSAIKKTAITKQREQTRRELAAYVAEGSMTPDDAERLLKAEPRRSCGS